METRFLDKTEKLFTEQTWINGIVALAIITLSLIPGEPTFFMAVGLMVVVFVLKKSTMQELGLNRPKSWIKTILLSFGLTVLFMLILSLVQPLILKLSSQPTDLSKFQELQDNLWVLIRTVIAVWFTAALAEEVIWRGFLMKYIAQLLGDRPVSWVTSLIITSVLFGFIHYYQGMQGVIQTGLIGLFLGAVYLLNRKRNLWLCILVHGIIDTLSLIMIYFGQV